MLWTARGQGISHDAEAETQKGEVLRRQVFTAGRPHREEGDSKGARCLNSKGLRELAGPCCSPVSAAVLLQRLLLLLLLMLLCDEVRSAAAPSECCRCRR